MAAPPQPLAGVRVIDLGQIYQGPYATLLMALAGAEVVKVEPVAGERLRGLAAGAPGMSFAMLNSNKKSITLDLKRSRGGELLIELVKHGDVLLENFAPGVMERLGVGAEVLRAANPRLIYASGTGFGLTGPDRDQLAMDHTIQAVSGMMSVTGTPDGPPLRAGGAVADILAGVHLYGAVVTALLGRERTGEGALVEVAMQESMYFTYCTLYNAFHRTGRVPGRSGNQPAGRASAPYNVYPTTDGHIAIICVTEEHWTRLLDLMGRRDLANDPRFATRADRGKHAEQVDQVIADWSKGVTRAEAERLARQHRIPLAPVRDLDEVRNDRHMHERGMLRWVEHRDMGRVVLPNSPLRFPDVGQLPLEPFPRLGEHNAEIYGGLLGLSGDDLSALAEEGVI
ncbi:MAG: CoA transferase [Myxococcota bacterium]